MGMIRNSAGARCWGSSRFMEDVEMVLERVEDGARRGASRKECGGRVGGR